MSMKRNFLAASILLAVTGTTATALISGTVKQGANDIGSAGAPHSAAAASQAHPLTSPSAKNHLSAPDSAAMSDAGHAAELERNPAVARAREVLREEKIKGSGKSMAGNSSSDRTALAAEQYSPRDVVVEADGTEHVRFNRDYQGLPVIGGDLVTHMKDGQLRSITKSMDLKLGKDGLAPAPALSSAQAVADAGVHFDGKFTQVPSTRTVYFAKDNEPKLAYEVTFAGVDEDRSPVRDLIYIDANDGGFLGRDAQILSVAASGTAYTLNRGKVTISTSQVTAAENPEQGAGYLLIDETRGLGKTLDAGGITVEQLLPAFGIPVPGKVMFDADNTWGNEQLSSLGRLGAEVHYGVAKTWDYYKAKYDRKGLRNDGKGVESVVNVSLFTVFGSPQGATNAFWASAVSQMVFGNGDFGVSNPVVALDVAGHEMSHGVNFATANLAYSGDSGGLNEANSDINGTLVEYFDNNANDPGDYLIGESVLLSGKPLRYMFKPSLDLRTDGRASFDCYPQNGFDPANSKQHDPHFTSGVANHFFYLLAEGQVVPKSHRKTLLPADLTCNGAVALKGISRDTAGQIWYRALTLYMTSQTSYPQAREATQLAAQDFIDRGLLKSAVVKSVACAWEAVDVPLPAGSNAARCI